MRNSPTARESMKNEDNTQTSTMGLNSDRPYNQVEELQMQNEKLRALIKDHEQELLRLYRKLNQYI